AVLHKRHREEEFGCADQLARSAEGIVSAETLAIWPGARAQRIGLKTSHGLRTASEVMFEERQIPGISVTVAVGDFTFDHERQILRDRKIVLKFIAGFVITQIAERHRRQHGNSLCASLRWKDGSVQ